MARDDTVSIQQKRPPAALELPDNPALSADPYATYLTATQPVAALVTAVAAAAAAAGQGKPVLATALRAARTGLSSTRLTYTSGADTASLAAARRACVAIEATSAMPCALDTALVAARGTIDVALRLPPPPVRGAAPLASSLVPLGLDEDGAILWRDIRDLFPLVIMAAKEDQVARGVVAGLIAALALQATPMALAMVVVTHDLTVADAAQTLPHTRDVSLRVRRGAPRVGGVVHARTPADVAAVTDALYNEMDDRMDAGARRDGHAHERGQPLIVLLDSALPDPGSRTAGQLCDLVAFGPDVDIWPLIMCHDDTLLRSGRGPRATLVDDMRTIAGRPGSPVGVDMDAMLPLTDALRASAPLNGIVYVTRGRPGAPWLPAIVAPYVVEARRMRAAFATIAAVHDPALRPHTPIVAPTLLAIDDRSVSPATLSDGKRIIAIQGRIVGHPSVIRPEPEETTTLHTGMDHGDGPGTIGGETSRDETGDDDPMDPMGAADTVMWDGPPVTIDVLGVTRPAVAVFGVPLTRPLPPHLEALLGSIAARAPEATPRSFLAALCAGDIPGMPPFPPAPPRARPRARAIDPTDDTLGTALTAIRRWIDTALHAAGVEGPSALLVDTDSVSLDPRIVTVDVARVVAMVQRLDTMAPDDTSDVELRQAIAATADLFGDCPPPWAIDAHASWHETRKRVLGNNITNEPDDARDELTPMNR